MTEDVNINNDKQRKPEYQNFPLGQRYSNPQTKTRMYNSLQKIACVNNVINTACNQQRQTRMAQKHAEFILEQKQNTENNTQGLPRTKKVQDIYRQERHLAFQNEENKIS